MIAALFLGSALLSAPPAQETQAAPAAQGAQVAPPARETQPAPAAQGTRPGPSAEVARGEPSRSAVKLGEPFDYAVALRHEPGEQVELLVPPDLSPFGALGKACRTAAEAATALTLCTLRLQLLDLGQHTIPTLQVKVRGPAGERLVPVTGAPVTGIATLAPKGPAASLPLHAPQAPPVKVPAWWPILAALGALAALAGAWLLWRWWRKRPRGAPRPVLSPQERFLRQLADLEAAGLPARGRRREHVARVADAVREYLAALAPQAALDLTSAELLAALAARPVAGVEPEPLRRFLDAADLVKFAKREPLDAECVEAVRFARELLARTAPTAGPAPAPGGRAA